MAGRVVQRSMLLLLGLASLSVQTFAQKPGTPPGSTTNQIIIGGSANYGTDWEVLTPVPNGTDTYYNWKKNNWGAGVQTVQSFPWG